MFAAGKSWAVPIVSFIMESRVKKFLAGMAEGKEQSRIGGWCFKLLLTNAQVTSNHTLLVRVSHMDRLASVGWRCNPLTCSADHIAMEGNRTFLDGVLFPGNSSSVFCLWWFLDMISARTLLFHLIPWLHLKKILKNMPSLRAQKGFQSILCL